MRGKFITLDGIDGAGKTTHLNHILDWFTHRNLPVLCTREPGGTPIGEALRALLLDPNTHANLRTETLMMFAARQQHLDEVIIPALESGTHVISDRFTDATFAYQGGGRQLPISEIAILEQWVQRGLQPHLTFILDVPITVSQQRLQAQGQPDRFEQESYDFYERTRQMYLRRAAENPQRYTILDSTQDKQTVAQQIQVALSRLLDEAA